MFIGRETIPTAERECRPLSPKTSTIKSENPFITAGCSLKSFVEFTIPVTLTILFTLFKSPNSSGLPMDNLDISEFNTVDAKYTTLQRSTLLEFLKEKLSSNLLQYNKKITQINDKNESIELVFEDNSSVYCDYLIISDGVFSTAKSLIANKNIKPK